MCKFYYLPFTLGQELFVVITLREKRVNSNTKNLTNNETEVYWKKYQRFFPEELRINEKNLPKEEWWD